DLKPAEEGREQVAIGRRDILSQGKQNRIDVVSAHRPQIVAQSSSSTDASERCASHAAATGMTGAAHKAPSPGVYKANTDHNNG
ncbi:MAG: hypothetical protein ACYDHO_05390, partial [Gaiellaceae bacterium]